MTENMKKTLLLCILTLLTHIAFAETTTSVFEDFSKLKKSQTVSPEYNTVLKTEVTSYINKAPTTFDKSLSQYFIVVDSSVKKQNLMLGYWDSTNQAFQLSPNMTKVSTGRTGSAQHFITPTGWVEQLPENGTYRAEGTKNENGIRGYGIKGMRVWDFGWQNATTGWLKKPEVRQIRMQMHATDPQYLEQRLGTPASQGCLRLSAETNQFLDKYAIIDRNIEQSKIKWALKKERTPVTNEGSFVLVVNTESTPTSVNKSSINVSGNTGKDTNNNNSIKNVSTGSMTNNNSNSNTNSNSNSVTPLEAPKVMPNNLTPIVIRPEESMVNTTMAPTINKTSTLTTNSVKETDANTKIKPSNLTPTIITPEGSIINTKIAPTTSRISTQSTVRETEEKSESKPFKPSTE